MHWNFATRRSTTRSTAQQSTVTGHRRKVSSALRFLEEVFVHALDDVGLPVLHADVVGDHELSKRDAVDENDPRGYAVSVSDGFVGEAARGDEDSAVGLRAVQGTDESLDFGAPDRVSGRLPLGLNVNLVQAERVLADDAVQAVIAGSA